ncbi:MAG: ErfK/YbiS/YcfS/YnhG family protein [uncultured bacterium]|nr:MAG: ErfK/YbiS/YcfS/YnhG family protein [uncultured bacterium]
MKNHRIKRKIIGNRLWLGIILLSLSVLIVYPLQAFSNDFEVMLVLEKTDKIESDDKIIINFSLPVVVSSIENGFSIFPSQKVILNWENNNKRLIITPQNSWKPQTTYTIQIVNGVNILLGNFDKTFKFKTIDFPKIVSFLPLAGEKDVAVDIEDPVRIVFDRSIEDYNIKFIVTPHEPLGWQLNDEKTQISLLAKDNFKWDTHYSIAVFLKNKQQSADGYVKTGETFFNTALPPAPEIWDKDPTVRSYQAKKYTQAEIKEGKYIDINISKQMMVIFENSQALDAYLISSGMRGMETPTGMFKIENKAARAWSSKYSLWMPNWMAILPSGEIGIHELPVWPGGFQEGANHLGIPVSHGCVRLGPGIAKRVFDWAEIGTPVFVH